MTKKDIDCLCNIMNHLMDGKVKLVQKEDGTIYESKLNETLSIEDFKDRVIEVFSQVIITKENIICELKDKLWGFGKSLKKGK